MFYALLSQIARPVVKTCLLMTAMSVPNLSAAEPSDPVASGELQATASTNSFPTPVDTEPLAADHPQLSPEASAAAIHLPEGFVASVFAAEPDVRNPIDMAWDHRGRLWVAENYTYAKSGVRFRDDLRDRVIVFTDQDGDGTPEDRKVFIDTVARLTSVEVGPGPDWVDDAFTRKANASGVWLMCPPQLLFVPDADHDLVADSAPIVVLDGFEIAQQNYHNFANGLRFGPDGWLYGRCGGSCPGRIGPPGTPDDQRVALEGGIWRYNLRSNRVEVICHGTTNPWGHDFNEFGDLFFINTVNGHLWHGIHGAHFNRPFTLDPNPNVYATIDQHADHYHFDTGQHWTKSRDGAANDFGGGHAHCGLMIYQESTWPESYRGSLMTLNFHGRRANRENLIRRGTGYVGTHGDDFFKSDDKWFRGMEMSAGPDGNVFVLDWSDLGECHEHTGVHRNSGRIYKISVTADQQRPLVAARLDVLASDDVARMGGLVLGTDRWFSHQAMLRLCELKRKGFDMSPLKKLFSKQDSLDAVTHCRVLWLSHLTSLDEEIFEPSRLNITDHDRVRVVTLRQAFENCPIDDVYGPNMACRAAWPLIMDDTREFVDEMGKLHLEDSPVLRLEVASILQRLPESLRTRAAMNLLKISGDRDEGDHNMAKMIWFGIMHRASTHPHEMVAVAAASDIPEATTYIARSLAEQVDTAPNAFRSLLNLGVQKYRLENDPLARLWCNAMLTGIEQGIIGVRRVDKPDAWPELRTLILAASPDRQRLVDQLDALFGEGQSVEQLQAILDNNNADPLERLAAFKGLVAAWHQDGSQDATVAARLAAAARPLIGDARVNLAAAESLATIEHADVARVLIDNHGRFRWPLRASVVSLLCARATFATALIERLEQGKFDKDAINASHVRSIVSLGNEDLTQRLEAVWGRVRETPGERRDEITRLQSMLTPARLRQADLHAGRALFDRSCAACHKMFGNGETVGPDLTGAQRGSLEYLLGNIVDPDAVVGADYRATKILTDDGRLLVGLVTSRNRRTLTIASAARTETISLDDIEEELPTETSPMPSGLLQPLSDDEIANLIGYLQSPTQVAAN